MSADGHIDTLALKRAIAIEDVVQSYGIALRPQGRSLVGLCPFHPDRRTPNLCVFPADDQDPGHFRCFACGRSGDAIQFVRLMDGLDFRTACERLQRQPACAGMVRPTASAPRHRPWRRWDRLSPDEQRVMNRVAEHSRWRFWQDEAARAYARERAIPEAVLRTCGVGYADGRSLLRVLSGPERDLAEQLGLLRRREDGSLREALAGRVVVPEVRAGNVIWCIGRALWPDARRRYLALAGERPVLGLERVAGRSEVFVTEGVFDWLTAVAWDLPACAVCGTSIPAERLGFLASAERITGVFDGDAAGRAADAAFAATFGPRWRSVSLPDGLDLNDLGRRPRGRETFFRRLAACRAPHA